MLESTKLQSMKESEVEQMADQGKHSDHGKHSSRNDAGFQKSAEEKPPGIFAELLDFLIHNKKWWLTPIFAVLLLVATVIVLSGTAVGPFIYALF